MKAISKGKWRWRIGAVKREGKPKRRGQEKMQRKTSRKPCAFARIIEGDHKRGNVKEIEKKGAICMPSKRKKKEYLSP